MPLVVLCGNPCSGKTTVCSLLIQKFRQLKSVIVVSPETSFKITKNEAYKDSAAQKNTRSALRSAIERELSNRHSVVILDALNNIKGVRYEIWCLARSVGTKYCLVHVLASNETCRARNQSSSNPYSPEIFEDLSSAFEIPDSKNRWEVPLFSLNTDSNPEPQESVLGAIVECICKEKSIGHRQTTLQPSNATSNPPLATTNLQHDIDKAAEEIVSKVAEAQREAGSEAIGRLSLDSELPALNLTRYVTIADLRRLKRGFLKLATQISFSRVTDSKTAKKLFLEYLQQNLET